MFSRLFPFTYKQSALIWLPIVFLGLALDQISKYIALHMLEPGVSVVIFPGFNFSLVFNFGAAFGFLSQDKNWQVLLLITIAIVATIGFTIWLARIPRDDRFEGLGIALMLSGALGNVIDRFHYGFVVDFLDFYVYDSLHWPSFNLADSFICVGAVLVVLAMWRKS